jgi:nucleoside 2-deoxyribosyltransferase
MPRCFVIQPFNEEFDELYDQVFAPAIREAGMEPYRVDRQPATNILVENIEAGIRDSDACLADISTDNPNVWYELGFAIASGKDVVIVCSGNRPHPLPFDVQHRNIFRYCVPEDRERLRADITARLKTLEHKRTRLERLVTFSAEETVGGLEGKEAAALLSVASNRLTSDATVHPRQVRHDMESAGFTAMAVTLALEELRRRRWVEEVPESDDAGHQYTAYRLTRAGVAWLERHQDAFRLVEPEAAA